MCVNERARQGRMGKRGERGEEKKTQCCNKNKNKKNPTERKKTWYRSFRLTEASPDYKTWKC